MPAILCKNIVKTYSQGPTKVEALRGVNLTVNTGELKLLMGPSGSGKTTLISIIAGILTPDAGQCLIGGVDLNHLPDKEKTHFRGQHIGFVFQAFNLIPMLTAEENIAIPLLINGVPREKALEKANRLLHEMEMEDKIGVLPNQLSGGQQQRVAIARGLVHDPQLVVCDEPTSFLDHYTGLKIMDLLKETVRKKNLTLIVVTHDPRLIPYADSIDHLEDGKIDNGKILI
jgi:putative ABC transport system ATP-binding protein